MAARDEILSNIEPQISFDQFAAVCRRHQLAQEELVTLAGLLHDRGDIVYFGEDLGLRDTVVLRPEWLTKAIGYVLEDRTTGEAGGVLDHARLREFWQERRDSASYPVQYHPYLLRLMEKFEVSYRLQDDQYKSLVAPLVPFNRPDLPWDRHTAVPEGIRTLAMVCSLSEPAPGLIAWLTVRHHRASTGRHWRRGVFLRHPIDAYASEALLELHDEGHLAVEVRAPSPDLFFNVLRESVEDVITHRWPGLEYQLLIPCPTRSYDGNVCSGVFKLRSLLGFRERGKSSIDCQECGEPHDIGRLLTGFAVPPIPLQPTLQLVQEQLSDVASGIDQLNTPAALALVMG
jgi:internalin A